MTTLRQMLLSSFADHEDGVALRIGAETFSYGEILGRAAALADAMDQVDGTSGPLAILGNHSLASYCGILAAFLSGRPYVPVNPKFPASRQAVIVDRSSSVFLLNGTQDEVAPEILTSCPKLRQLPFAEDALHRPVPATGKKSSIAYIMFTSGTTGEPKGVMVTTANLVAYCEAFAQIAPIGPGDRCTQLFDLSFDLSVHDILVTWLSGATLAVAQGRDMLDPVGFAARENVTCWFSVPSVAAMAKRFRRLKPNCLPDLRLSLFCGEALPASLAKDWVAAAPNSRLVNVYGPTEATIAITAYELDPTCIPDEAVVPIGWPYAGSEVIIVDHEMVPVAAGEAGELLLGGPQISDGYLNNAVTTDAKFLHRAFAGCRSQRWYRSGDIGIADPAHGILYRGRVDDQVKISGYRVEIAEVEECLRQHMEGEVAVVAVTSGGNAAEFVLAAAVVSADVEFAALADASRLTLPAYMVPAEFIRLPTLPLNANGKVDRQAIARLVMETRKSK